MNAERWGSLCARLSCADGARRFPVLEAAYAESHRHYHTAEHIDECLDLFQQVDELAEHPDEVELAVWMHDVVYRPRRTDNEERSAGLAAEWLAGCQVDPALIDRVRSLIMCTRHTEAPLTRDEALLQDIDLGVLGSTPQRFAEYEAQVRREYRSVPSFLFRRRRAEILESFLRRSDIYRTPWFRERFELAARRNLGESVAALRGRDA
jgi:predicted metal-dependent HD superfamily phosphohydrolase